MKTQLFSFYKENFFVSPILDRMPGQGEAKDWDFALVEDESGVRKSYYAGATYEWKELQEGDLPASLEFVDEDGLGKAIKYRNAPQFAAFMTLA